MKVVVNPIGVKVGGEGALVESLRFGLLVLGLERGHGFLVFEVSTNDPADQETSYQDNRDPIDVVHGMTSPPLR